MIKIAEKKHGREEGRPEIEQLNAYKVFQTRAVKKDLGSRQNRNLHKMNHGWNFRRCWVFLFSPIVFFKRMHFLLIEIYGYFMTKLITLKWFKYSRLFNNKEVNPHTGFPAGKEPTPHIWRSSASAESTNHRLCDTAVFTTEKYQHTSGSSQFKPMLLTVM